MFQAISKLVQLNMEGHVPRLYTLIKACRHNPHSGRSNLSVEITFYPPDLEGDLMWRDMTSPWEQRAYWDKLKKGRVDYENFRKQVKLLFPGIPEDFGVEHCQGPDEVYRFFVMDLYKRGDAYRVCFFPNNISSTSWKYGEKQPGSQMVYGRGNSLEEALVNYKSQAEVSQ